MRYSSMLLFAAVCLDSPHAGRDGVGAERSIVAPVSGVEPSRGYIGSATCAGCHKAQAERQLRSNMSRSAFRPTRHPLFDRFKNLGARAGSARFAFSRQDELFKLLVSDGKNQIEIPVAWALGSGMHAVTFIAKMGNGRYLESRVTYYSKTGELDFTPGRDQVSFKGLMEAAGHINDRPEASRCISCHTTGSRDDGRGDEIEVSEPGVRCESCHGEGLSHFEAVRRGEEVGTGVQYAGRSSPSEVMALCGRCHRDPPNDPSRVDWKDPAVTRFQPVGLSQSRCYVDSGRALTCLSCHDAHGDARRNEPEFYARVCAECHTPSKNPPAISCTAGASPDCSGCHMPKVRAFPHITFSNHWIGIYTASDRLVPRRRRE